MAKVKQRRRASRSLEIPFSAEALAKFSGELPKKAKIRIVTVSSTGSIYRKKKSRPKPRTYLEAVWWEKLSKSELDSLAQERKRLQTEVF